MYFPEGIVTPFQLLRLAFNAVGRFCNIEKRSFLRWTWCVTGNSLMPLLCTIYPLHEEPICFVVLGFDREIPLYPAVLVMSHYIEKCSWKMLPLCSWQWTCSVAVLLTLGATILLQQYPLVYQDVFAWRL